MKMLTTSLIQPFNVSKGNKQTKKKAAGALRTYYLDAAVPVRLDEFDMLILVAVIHQLFIDFCETCRHKKSLFQFTVCEVNAVM